MFAEIRERWMPGTPALLCCGPKPKYKGSQLRFQSLSGMQKCPSGTRFASMLTFCLLLSVRVGAVYFT